MKETKTGAAALFVAIVTLCLTACGDRRQAAEGPVTDTVSGERLAVSGERLEARPTELDEPEGGFLLKRDGIVGVVELGQRLDSLPERVKNLYNKMSVTQERDETDGTEYVRVEFTLKGKPALEVRSWEGQTVDLIHIDQEGLTFRAGGKDYGVGSEVKELEKAPNLRRMREYEGVSCLNGIFLFDADGLVTDLWLGGLPQDISKRVKEP